MSNGHLRVSWVLGADGVLHVTGVNLIAVMLVNAVLIVYVVPIRVKDLAHSLYLFGFHAASYMLLQLQRDYPVFWT